MKAVKPIPLVETTNEARALIAILHDALDYLIAESFVDQTADQAASFQTEKDGDLFGDETKRLLGQIQAKTGIIGADPKGETTMRRINDKLVVDRRLAKVGGTLKNKNGEPLYGLEVKLSEVVADQSGDEIVDFSSRSSFDGSYAIFLDLEDPAAGGESTPPEERNYRLQVFAGEEKPVAEIIVWKAFADTSDSFAFAAPVEVKDKRFEKSIEFPTISGHVRKLLKLNADFDREFSDIRDHQIAHLRDVLESPWPIESLEHLAASSAISKWLWTENDAFELPAPFFYGLFRTYALLFVRWELPPDSILEVSLRVLSSGNGVPPGDLETDWIRRLLDHMVSSTDDEIRDCLRGAVDDRLIEGKTTGSFPVFRDGASGLELSESVVRSLQILRISWFLDGWENFRKLLSSENIKEEKLKDQTIAEVEKLAQKIKKFPQKGWVETVGLTKEEAKLVAGRLKFYPDVDKAIKAEQVVEVFPDSPSDGQQFLSGLLELVKPEKVKESDRFLALGTVDELKKEGFDIGEVNTDELNFEGLEEKQAEKHRKTLRILQRIFRITPEPKKAVVLLSGYLGGLTFYSAAEIRSFGRMQFARIYLENAKNFFGDAAEGTSYLEQARHIYAKAEERSTAASLCMTELASAVGDAEIPGMNPGFEVKPIEGALDGLPNWETLFGSLDSCACKQCASVHGPAAYLVDTLEFLKRLNVGRGVIGAGEDERILTAFEVFNHRRPDIAGLELNCENAETPMPHIDLVCEILEDAIIQEGGSISLHIPNGKISATNGLIDALHGIGVTVTENGTVSTDYLGWKVIRDENVLFLLQPQPKTDGSIDPIQPKWWVHELRQTRRNAEELAAEPAYVNQAAYRSLASSTLDLSLPFDLFHVETISYLSGLKLHRKDVMRDLSTIPRWEARWEAGGEHEQYWYRVSAETLGLTEALGMDLEKEWELITCDNSLNQHRFWSASRPPFSGEGDPPPPPDMAEILEAMAVFRHFQKETGLSHEEVIELFDGQFVNPKERDPDTHFPVGKLKIVHPDAPEDRCNTAKMRIEGLDREALDRINRILRLQIKQPDWSLDFIDRMIMAPAIGRPDPKKMKGMLDAKCLRHIAQLIQIAEDFGEDFEDVVSLFVNLETRGERPDYEDWFVLNGPDGQINENFLLSNICLQCDDGEHGGCDCTTIQSQSFWFAYCLNLSQEEVDEIIAQMDGNACLTIDNISRVWAWARLARMTKLDVEELLVLLDYLDIESPFASPEKLDSILAAVRLLKEMSLPLEEVRYLIEHVDEDGNPPVDRELSVEQLEESLKEIVAGFKSAEESKLDPIEAGGEPTGAGLRVDEAATLLSVFLDEIPVVDPATSVALITFLGERTKENAQVLNETLAALIGGIEIDEIDPLLRGLFVSAHEENGLWKIVPLQDSAESDDEYAHRIERQIEILTTVIGDYSFAVARNEVLSTTIAKTFSISLEEAVVLLGGCRMDVEIEATGDIERQPFGIVLLRTDGGSTADGEQGEALRRLHKITTAAKRLDFDLPELEWGFHFDRESNSWSNRFEGPLDWLSLDRLPITKMQDNLPEAFGKLAKLLEGLQFIRSLPRKTLPTDRDEKYGAMDLLVETVQGIESGDQFVKNTSFVFGIPQNALLEASKGIALESAQLRMPKNYARWSKAVAALADLGLTNFERPTDWYDRTSNDDPIHQLLDANLGRDGNDQVDGADVRFAIKASLKRRTPLDGWLEALKKLQNPIRERKRDALVAYSLAEQEGDPFETVDDLYDYYLIDPLMESCMDTSRIVQAHGAVQAFVQRCTLGLEPKVDVAFDGSDADSEREYEGSEWGEWYWMKNFRVWEANRKVFLYPENWLEPDLRDDKSEFFKELEQNLLQAPLTDESAEEAARAYLEKVDEVAFLEVMAAHYEEESLSGKFITRTEACFTRCCTHEKRRSAGLFLPSLCQ